MKPTELTVRADDGPMGAVLASPDRPPTAGVIVLMEAFGVNAHIRDVCERFAERGYAALAPDLYHRSGRFVTGDYSDPSGVMGHFATLDTDGMARDIDAATTQLVDDAGIGRDAIGVIGFCLGGYGAVLAASRTSPAIAAGFYGAGISIRRDGSPLATLADEFDAIACPVHLFYGADDPVIPPVEVEATRRRLSEVVVEHSVNVYEGAGHGFFCDARGSYEAKAATDAWRRVVDAFARALPGTTP